MDTGVFQFCRLVFRQAANGDGYGWSVDYPSADENLSTRLSELTRAPISIDESGRPNHVLIRLTQPDTRSRGPWVRRKTPCLWARATGASPTLVRISRFLCAKSWLHS